VCAPMYSASVGSARLEGYKGPLKATPAKKNGASRADTKPKVTVKR
jgi:predicted small lipoprotein YifL